MVDTFGLIGRMLDDMVPAAKPKIEIKRPLDGYRREPQRASWRTMT